jgi:hypothetical protein
MRLRCRAHNQLEAERAFGVEFMARKRHEARLAATEARTRVAARATAQATARAGGAVGARAAAEEQAARDTARAKAKEQAQDVLAGLRGLGCRADEALRAAEFCETLHDATLEERMRAALKFIGGRLIQGRATAQAIQSEGTVVQKRIPAQALHPQSQGAVV